MRACWATSIRRSDIQFELCCLSCSPIEKSDGVGHFEAQRSIEPAVLHASTTTPPKPQIRHQPLIYTHVKVADSTLTMISTLHIMTRPSRVFPGDDHQLQNILGGALDMYIYRPSHAPNGQAIHHRWSNPYLTFNESTSTAYVSCACSAVTPSSTIFSQALIFALPYTLLSSKQEQPGFNGNKYEEIKRPRPCCDGEWRILDTLLVEGV